MGSFQEFLQYQASAVEGFARAFLPRVPLTGTGVREASHWVKFRGFGRLQAFLGILALWNVSDPGFRSR